MSKTASKPLPSKRTPGKSASPALRRAVAGGQDTAATAEEPAGPPRRGGRGQPPGRRPGRLGGPGRRGIGRRGGRCRGRANRRRRPDRRSDPHLLDADGRNPHAQPRARRWSGPAHRAQPERFRHDMLATDYMLQAAVGLLESIRDGRARLDRTIEVSVINLREKRRLLKLLGPNVHTLEQPVRSNREDFPIAIRKGRPRSGAERPGSGWSCRRGRAVRLVEELGLRTQRLAAAPGPAASRSAGGWTTSTARSAELGRGGEAAGRRPRLRKELCHLMRITLESPATLRRRIARIAALRRTSTKPPSGTSPPATCGWSSPSPSATATAA